MDATGHAALADRALGRQVILPRCTGSFNISRYESGLQLYCTATVSHRVLRRVVLGRASTFDRRRDPLAARRRLGRGLWVLFGGRLTRRRAKTPIADMIARACRRAAEPEGGCVSQFPCLDVHTRQSTSAEAWM